MSKLFSFNMVTLNGFFEGPTPWSIEWHTVDEDFQRFAIAQLETIGTLVLGRKTYEGFAGYWSSNEAMQSDPEVASAMNAVHKIVVSKTLERADWHNSRVLRQPGRRAGATQATG